MALCSSPTAAARPLVHGMTVVTRHVADFEPSQVAIVDPWR